MAQNLNGDAARRGCVQKAAVAAQQQPKEYLSDARFLFLPSETKKSFENIDDHEERDDAH